MTKHTTTPKVAQSHSPEFKLRVVLEYIRHPKEQKQICKTNRISEDLLTKWHQEFVERAGLIFAEHDQPLPQPPPKPEIANGSDTSTGESQISSTQPLWGIRINDGLRQTYLSPSSPKERPAWLKGFDVDQWEHQRGVAFWNEQTQVIEIFYARDVLPMLEKLRTTHDWQTEGLPIIRHISRRIYSETPKPKRSSKKKQTEQPPQLGPKPEYEEIDEERLRLNPFASAEALAFLTQHETLLKEMADKDQKQIDEASHLYWNMVFRGARDNEVRTLDLSTRPLPWRKGAESHTLICELGPYRGTLQLGQNAWYWICSIEQPDKRKYSSPALVRLEEALVWTEQELLMLQKTASEEPPPPPPQPPAKPKMDLSPYLIDPAALEPDRISYRVLIEVEHEPDFFKTMEFSPGEIFRYDEEYPTPRRLSSELNIDPSKATIEWPGGFKGSTYLIYSKATYFQETVVAAQAQQLWDRSSIEAVYQAGKIKQARYGCEEVETGYWFWLGGLPDPKNPWGKHRTRVEYMADCAMHQTILHALDSERFKEWFGSSSKHFSDEEMLEMMHKRRTESKVIPENARAESEQWLRDHAEEIAQHKKERRH